MHGPVGNPVAELLAATGIGARNDGAFFSRMAVWDDGWVDAPDATALASPRWPTGTPPRRGRAGRRPIRRRSGVVPRRSRARRARRRAGEVRAPVGGRRPGGRRAPGSDLAGRSRRVRGGLRREPRAHRRLPNACRATRRRARRTAGHRRHRVSSTAGPGWSFTPTGSLRGRSGGGHACRSACCELDRSRSTRRWAADHAQAVERLEMATLEKVAMRFPERFWPESIWQITHVAERPGVSGVVRLQPSRGIADAGRLLQPGHLAHPRRAPGRAAGRPALEILRKMFGSVPDPEETLVTDWVGTRGRSAPTATSRSAPASTTCAAWRSPCQTGSCWRARRPSRSPTGRCTPRSAQDSGRPLRAGSAARAAHDRCCPAPLGLATWSRRSASASGSSAIGKWPPGISIGSMPSSSRAMKRSQSGSKISSSAA